MEPNSVAARALADWRTGRLPKLVVFMDLNPASTYYPAARDEFRTICDLGDKLFWNVLTSWSLRDVRVITNDHRSEIWSMMKDAVLECDAVLLNCNYPTEDDYYFAGLAHGYRKPLMLLGRPEPALWVFSALLQLPTTADFALFADTFARYSHMPVFEGRLRFVSTQFPVR